MKKQNHKENYNNKSLKEKKSDTTTPGQQIQVMLSKWNTWVA